MELSNLQGGSGHFLPSSLLPVSPQSGVPFFVDSVGEDCQPIKISPLFFSFIKGARRGWTAENASAGRTNVRLGAHRGTRFAHPGGGGGEDDRKPSSDIG